MKMLYYTSLLSSGDSVDHTTYYEDFEPIYSGSSSYTSKSKSGHPLTTSNVFGK
jgi:hypothetical protein